MLSGNAIENDRTYNFTAAHTLCRKVGTHSNWDHAASYKKKYNKIYQKLYEYKYVFTKGLTSGGAETALAEDSFNSTIFLSSFPGPLKQKKKIILSTAEIKKPGYLCFLGVFISSYLLMGQRERLEYAIHAALELAFPQSQSLFTWLM